MQERRGEESREELNPLVGLAPDVPGGPAVPDSPEPPAEGKAKSKAEAEREAAAARLLAHLNDRRRELYADRPKKRVKPFTEAPGILALLRKGVHDADIGLVIDWSTERGQRLAEFQDGEYIQPSTLFGPKKFPDYLRLAQEWDANQRPEDAEEPGPRRLEYDDDGFVFRKKLEDGTVQVYTPGPDG
jgi:uncharacterized phage protein (TIGR02220 family)